MKVVALISGGKDSCYSMLQCVAAGHEIVALANLCPETKDELDSYMYQTVGHQGVELYAEAMGLPLFRKPTQGIALLHDKVYTPTPQDEVEDLFQLLEKVKNEVAVEAVTSGAVLSDYQRLRVENVCSRLGLVSLAYLWRRDQSELLQEMIDCGVKAIIIKVAALGLDPVKHLGMQLGEIQPHLLKMKEKYGLNVCGEGGEYETFTLDCPLFTKTVVIDDYETVIHSNDAIAPVGYLNFKQMRLVSKPVDVSINLADRIASLPIKVKNADDYLSDLEEEAIDFRNEDEVDQSPLVEDIEACEKSTSIKLSDPVLYPVSLVDAPSTVSNNTGWTWFSNIIGSNTDIVVATKMALHKLCALLNEHYLSPSDLIAITLYIRDMSEYVSINNVYLDVLSHPNPPVRICVEILLSADSPILIEALAYKLPEGTQTPKKHTMHVQSISHWAPANIGPYSQAVRVKDTIYIAGQIGLIPGTLSLVDGGIRKQARLALRHVGRLIQAMDPDSQLRDVVQGVCYVTNVAYIQAAKVEWERRTNNAIIDYVVVQRLPRDASVEWHLWAHRGNSRFDYEETGCCLNENRISIRRRWNYENTVSAVVCYASAGSSVSNSGVSSISSEADSEPVSEEDLDKIIRYAIQKLLQGDSAPTDSVLNLRLFYKINKPLELTQILRVLSQIKEFKISSSVIPVSHLHHPNTFISIVIIKHD